MYKDPKQRNKHIRELKARRQAQWFADKTCAHCGSVERLEIDHIDPTTKITHKIWSWSEERRNAELAKCRVLCHDCHVVKTRENGDNFNTSRAKITEDDVREIRRLVTIDGWTHRKTADLFNLARSTVSYIISGKIWGSVR